MAQRAGTPWTDAPAAAGRKRRWRLLAWGTAAALALAAGPQRMAGADPLVAQALAAGELDLQTALLYELYSVRQPELLPARFVTHEPPGRCATPLLLQALGTLRTAAARPSPALARALARPGRTAWVRSPAGRCCVHFDRTGVNAVDPADGDGNGTPDYVDAVATLADSILGVLVGPMGYRPPLGDGGAGGGDELDIYLSAIAGGYYGWTYPDLYGAGGTTAASYIELDNDYEDAVYHAAHQTPGLDGLRVTLAHELYHAVQFAYYAGWDASWWQEATATWMEETAFPAIDDYLQYVDAFLGTPEVGLDRPAPGTSREYGAVLFPLFLGQRFAPSVVRRSWEEIGLRQRWDIEALDRAVPGGLADAFGEFVVWNCLTGPRYHAGRSYADGALYRGPDVGQLDTPAGSAVTASGALDHLACRYVAVRPALRPGGLVLSVRTGPGRWRNRALLICGDSVEVRPADRELRLSGWHAWDEVVLLLAVTETTSTGFTYDVSAEYDPDLVEGTPPVAMRLGPGYPNPFRAGQHPAATLPFELDRPSQVTRLSIYAPDGTPVRVLDLGPRAARAYASDTWDGRSEAGVLVGSGVYDCVLEAEGRRARQRLAVVR